MSLICKKTLRLFIWILLLSIVSLNWIILHHLLHAEIPKYQIYTVNFPKDQGSPYHFNTQWVFSFIKHKKQIHFYLDGNKNLNNKKINIIRFETQKLFYTSDLTRVIIIDYTDDTPISELFKIIQICNQDLIPAYAVIKNRFIIFNPPLPKDERPKKEIKPIYL